MKNFLHLSARCMRLNTFDALVTATTQSVIVTLTALLVGGCATHTFEQPASLGADLQSRAGVAPGWTKPDAKAIDAQALHAAAVTALPNPLNEVDAVAIALDASPSIAKMISQTNALRAEAIDISTPSNPVLNFTSGVPLDSMSAVPIFAMLMFQIDELWKQPLRSEAARENYQAALLSLGAGAVALAVETRVAWHDVAMRSEERNLAQNDLQITKNLLAIARERFAVGESTGDAVAKSQAELTDAHHRLMQAREMLSAAQLSLMALLGRAEASTDWRTGAPDSSSAFAIHAPIADEQKLLAALADSRLDVRAAQAQANAAKSKVELARRNRSNKLDVGAGFDRDMEGDQAVAFSANVELPIFNNGSSRIDKAEAELQTANIEAERVRQAAILELRGAMVKALAIQEKRDISAENSLAPSAETFKRAQLSADVGEGSRREAIDAQHALNHAKLELNDLERQRRGARLALAKAAGFLPAEVLP
ncbi:MAG: TolC family protein [Phycisphaerales bacterium]|nr:TolC family protein [Phycisphaerales bacterium]